MFPINKSFRTSLTLIIDSACIEELNSRRLFKASTAIQQNLHANVSMCNHGFTFSRTIYAFSQMVIRKHNTSREILLNTEIAELCKIACLGTRLNKMTSGIFFSFFLRFIEVIYAHETFFFFFAVHNNLNAKDGKELSADDQIFFSLCSCRDCNK